MRMPMRLDPDNPAHAESLLSFRKRIWQAAFQEACWVQSRNLGFLSDNAYQNAVDAANQHLSVWELENFGRQL